MANNAIKKSNTKYQNASLNLSWWCGGGGIGSNQFIETLHEVVNDEKLDTEVRAHIDDLVTKGIPIQDFRMSVLINNVNHDIVCNQIAGALDRVDIGWTNRNSRWFWKRW